LTAILIVNKMIGINTKANNDNKPVSIGTVTSGVGGKDCTKDVGWNVTCFVAFAKVGTRVRIVGAKVGVKDDKFLSSVGTNVRSLI
jgi:hypothetical protein